MRARKVVFLSSFLLDSVSLFGVADLFSMNEETKIRICGEATNSDGIYSETIIFFCYLLFTSESKWQKKGVGVFGGRTATTFQFGREVSNVCDNSAGIGTHIAFPIRRERECWSRWREDSERSRCSQTYASSVLPPGASILCCCG